MTPRTILLEEQALKFTLNEEAEWPEFVLNQAEVVNENGDYQSLLEVDDELPAKVRGTLPAKLPPGLHTHRTSSPERLNRSTRLTRSPSSNSQK